MQLLAYVSAARFGPLKLSCQTKLKQPSEINYLHIYSKFSHRKKEKEGTVIYFFSDTKLKKNTGN